MATRKRSKCSMSHPVEVVCEVYGLKAAERRLLAIADALRMSAPDPASSPNRSALQEVLRRAICGEANVLAETAGRLNDLLGRQAVKLHGGA